MLEPQNKLNPNDIVLQSSDSFSLNVFPLKLCNCKNFDFPDKQYNLCYIYVIRYRVSTIFSHYTNYKL